MKNVPQSHPYPSKAKNYIWLMHGLFWGVMMFLTMEIILPKIDHEPIVPGQLINGGVIWLVGGLIFGLSMKFIRRQ
jgi:hypothetical protein